MSPSLLNAAFAAACLMAAMLTVNSLRLRTMVRYFALSSLFLSLLIAGLGYLHESEHFYSIAFANFVFKTVAIPALIAAAARRSGASKRLRAYLRPASTYMVLLLILVFVFIGIHRSPFFTTADPGYLLYLAVALVLMGFVMMILRRDILSQIVGFLIMENGIAMFSYATVNSIPVIIELGIFATVTVGVLLMSILSHHVRLLYGTEDTDQLRSLID